MPDLKIVFSKIFLQISDFSNRENSRSAIETQLVCEELTLPYVSPELHNGPTMILTP